MLADEHPEMDARGRSRRRDSRVTIHVYVEDVDTVFERAIEAGAQGAARTEDKFYGDRSAQLEDPFGHHWSIATHVEDVPPDEMAKRAAEEAAATGG